MNAILGTCLLLAVAATPVIAQSDSKQQTAGAMNCPMMADGEMHKQMADMVVDMRAMMDGISDPAAKTRMKRMHEHMRAMMANMQKMHGGMMQTPTAETGKAAEAPAASPPAAVKEDHEAHHPAK
jgi:hypothetical protein